jgi:hypothetical protein
MYCFHRIEFKDERGHKKTATFLPEVPLEQGILINLLGKKTV